MNTELSNEKFKDIVLSGLYEKRLLKYLFDSSRPDAHNPIERPSANDTETLNVSVKFFLNQVMDVVDSPCPPTRLKSPSDIRFSSSQLGKQHPRYEKAVSRISLAEAIYAWPCENISRGSADSPHSRPYQDVWDLVVEDGMWVSSY
ncbi:unnamed protein product [Schistosoma curassoni]|uniref:Uncharacterized protein n=1 Tax=Schistosoma curassoni TaxID=6186 RepID=A0A183KA34_9TREM|nr:unnamed protein product [Schistosoma curassoni]